MGGSRGTELSALRSVHRGIGPDAGRDARFSLHARLGVGVRGEKFRTGHRIAFDQAQACGLWPRLYPSGDIERPRSVSHVFL
eukprot:202251-Prymnesium_polylepis.1